MYCRDSCVVTLRTVSTIICTEFGCGGVCFGLNSNMQKVAVLLLALMVVAAVATEVDTEVDAEKRGKVCTTTDHRPHSCRRRNEQRSATLEFGH